MKVIIVGAGPCGLLLAMLLAKQNIQVQVLDGAQELDLQPRATHYSAPANLVLEKAGVLDEIRRRGFLPKGVCWRKEDGTRIAGLTNLGMPDSDPRRMVCLILGEVIEILHKEAVDAGIELLMKHQVVGLDTESMKPRVDVKLPSGETAEFTADYIVGCDGANSQVRRSLFGDWEFPGFSWEPQIIATNCYYDFQKYGWEDSNFIIHPKNWFMAAKITNDGMYRITYGDEPGLTKEEYIKRVPQRYKEFLPGHPDPESFKITNVGPYKMHQRLAQKLRVKGYLLAGDAAHLCNPFGGLGLTGGIVDVGDLSDCLIGIHKGVADESILDKYSQIRREKYETIVNPVSTANFKRMWTQDVDKTLANDEFFVLLRKAETDQSLMDELNVGMLALMHDFTQYYKAPPVSAL